MIEKMAFGVLKEGSNNTAACIINFCLLNHFKFCSRVIHNIIKLVKRNAHIGILALF